MTSTSQSHHGIVIHHTANAQVAAARVPGAHYKGTPAFQTGYHGKNIPTPFAQGDLGSIYTYTSTPIVWMEAQLPCNGETQHFFLV